MARILLLQEDSSSLLRNSLKAKHSFVEVHCLERAMHTLRSEKVDLIISRVNLSVGSVFDFLRSVRTDPDLRHIPFICVCVQISKYGPAIRPIISKAALLLGATRYLDLEDYAGKDGCNYEALRQAIEDCLSQESRLVNDGPQFTNSTKPPNEPSND